MCNKSILHAACSQNRLHGRALPRVALSRGTGGVRPCQGSGSRRGRRTGRVGPRGWAERGRGRVRGKTTWRNPPSARPAQAAFPLLFLLTAESAINSPLTISLNQTAKT